MSTLRLPGLLTGIDTNSLISQLMALERRTLNRYEQRKDIWDERKSALSTLESRLSSLRSSVRALSDADELRAFATASSDTDMLTAEASYNAFEGNHTVVINQLATAERWVHTAGVEYAEDYVKAGTFIYSYNHQETTITTTATTTLEDFVGLINNDANNPGVTASLLHYNKAYHLVLNGNEAGTDYGISINASSTEVWEAKDAFTVDNDNATLSTKITELDQFDDTGGLQGDEYITISGTDHNGYTVSGTFSVTENTKLTHLISEINSVFAERAKAVLENGKIVLTDSTCGTSSLSLTLSYDKGSGQTDLTLPDEVADWDVTQGGDTTASGLNNNFEPADFIETQSAQDSNIKVDGYPVSTSAEVQTLAPTTAPGSGTYTLTYDGETTGNIAYDADTDTIKAALETLSNVDPDDITVDGGANGLASGALTFTFTGITGDVNLITIDPTNLDQSAKSNYTILEATKGSDGYISRSSNTVDDVIHGVTLHLHDTTDANGEEITLTRDIQSVKDKLNSMVTAYNSAVVYIQEKTGYNDVLKTAGILMGDYIVSTIKSQLSTPLYAQTSGFIVDIDTFLMPGQIGLELGSDGMLTLNTNVFDEAIAEDYMGVLAIIGADKTGSSTSNTIEFYGASSRYTTAGTYQVEVDISSGAIADARIRKEGETEWRTPTWSGNIITGISTFDDNGDPVYPENGLQLSVDLSQDDGTYTATVRVKQGFTGAVEDAIDRMLKTTTGSIQIDQEHVSDQIELLQDKIEAEEERLTGREERLIARFARLERMLALIQNQMAALGFGMMG